MTCQRCGEEIRTLYVLNDGREAERSSWSAFAISSDPKAIWLCADCVDEVAEATA